VTFERSPADLQVPNGPIMTWCDVYETFGSTTKYSLVDAKFINLTNILTKMVFTTPECGNCELTGTRKKPDFWVDLN